MVETRKSGREITPIETRFWARVDKTEDCWQWRGAKTTLGYGTIGTYPGNKTLLVHRFAYEMLVGKIPDGLYVCHRCDNPGCVNPAHLFLGTAKDNMHDCLAKGRFTAKNVRKGRPLKKVTDAQVRDIRNRVKNGERQTDLAKEYAIHFITVNLIVRRVNRKSVSDFPVRERQLIDCDGGTTVYHSFGLTFASTSVTALASGRTPAAWITIQARSGNAGTIRIVSNDQTANGTITPTVGGTLLVPSASLTMPFFGAPLPYDLQKVYGVASNANDGIDVSYGS